MQRHQKDNAKWAEENGYELNAETTGAISNGASSLDIFRKAEDFREHIVGIHRNRPFEILDIMVRYSGDHYYPSWKTIVLIPIGGLNLPNFDLIPRRETAGMNFLGIKGLDLKLAPTASQDERQLVDAFNKNYSLFGGGVFEAMEASIKSADHLVPSLSEIASICKPGVLRFLSTATTGFIEVQDGYLAIRAPETRIISPGVRDTILQGSERDGLLTVANDFLDVLANAANEAPLRALTLENTFNPRQVLGIVIGGAIGFFGGGFFGILLLFLPRNDYLSMNVMLALVPALSFGGAVVGSIIGRTLTRG
jgi:hypothetical protein